MSTTEATETKSQFTPEITEFETHDLAQRKNAQTKRLTEAMRLGLTVLTLLIGIMIMSTTADSIAVYKKTSLSEDYLLPLWPFDFNLGPNIAIMVAGVVVFLSSIISVAVNKVSAVRI